MTEKTTPTIPFVTMTGCLDARLQRMHRRLDEMDVAGRAEPRTLEGLLSRLAALRDKAEEWRSSGNSGEEDEFLDSIHKQYLKIAKKKKSSILNRN